MQSSCKDGVLCVVHLIETSTLSTIERFETLSTLLKSSACVKVGISSLLFYFNALMAVGALLTLSLIDFTLSNARRFYSSMENPLAVKGLTTSPLSKNTVIVIRELKKVHHQFQLPGI